MSVISSGNGSDEGINRNESNSKLWSISFILLIIASLITTMGFNMVYTTISKYAMQLKGSLALAGLVSGIFSIAALVMRPFSGLAADIFNKKRLCILANVLIGLSIAGYAVSPNISLLLFFRILHGISFGISSTVNIAMAAEFIPRERMGEGMGYYGIGQVIASIIGPNAGIYIIEKTGFQSMFYITSMLTFLSAVLLIFLPYVREVKQALDRSRKITVDSLIAKEVIIYSLTGGMFSFGTG
jgi:MFS family permease